MKTAALALVALLGLMPAIAFAACTGGHRDASMSCAEGTLWNPQTKTCETTSS